MADDDLEDIDPELEARQAGYSSDEIELHQVQAAREALANGYSVDDIRGHLGYGSGYQTQQAADAHWQSTDPDLQQALLMSGTALADNPLLRSAYAGAMRDKDVVSPADFTDTWAAGAANSIGDSADLGELGQQSEALAGALPPRKDFIDGALALASGNPQLAINNLITHWKETGEEPAEAVLKARQDPDLQAKLTTAAPGRLAQIGTGLLDDIVRLGQNAAHVLPQGFLDTLNDGVDSVRETLGLRPLGRITLDQIDAMVKERDRVTHEQGYDGWLRTAGQIAGALPFATSLGLTGPGAIAAMSLTGGLAATAFTPSTAKDFWTEKGRQLAENVGLGAGLGLAVPPAFKALGKAIGKMTPDAAKSFYNVMKGLNDPTIEVVSPGAENPVQEMAAQAAQDLHKPASYEYVAGPRVKNPIEAYHASPHDFDKFSSEKIGAGEGTQQEGHGLYFAENPDVHEAYKAQFTDEGATANAYKVNLHVDRDLMLDRDKAISEQTPQVKTAIQKVEGEVGKKIDEQIADWESTRGVMNPDAKIQELQLAKAEALHEGVPAGEWLDRARHYLGNKETSELLKKEGLQGISYLDSGSAGLFGETSSSAALTRNHVIFHDDRIQLTEKNGLPFAEDATPIQKLQALARDAKPGVSTLEQAAEGEDPATIELARSHDAAFSVRQLLGGMMQSVGKLAMNEAGSVPVGPLFTPEQLAGQSRWRDNKDFVRGMLDKFQGQTAQATAKIMKQFDKFELALAPHMAEFQAQKALGAMGNTGDTVLGKFYQYVEGRSNGVTIDPSNPLAPWADLFRDANQAVDKQLRMQTVGEIGPRVKADLDARRASGALTEDEYRAEYEKRSQEQGVLNYNGYIRDYLAHMVKDPDAVTNDWVNGTGKFGSRANLAQRQGPPTVIDLLNAGYDLKFDSPGKLLLHDVTAKMHYSYAADMFDDARAKGYIRWGAAKLPTDVELGTSFGQKFTGDPDNPVIKAYADPTFEKNVRRLLDRGIHGSDNVGGPLYTAALRASNNLTALKLALPIFHMQTVGIGIVANALGGGLRGMMAGDPSGALKAIFGGLTGADYRQGMIGHELWAAGAPDAAINALRDAGANFENRMPAYERYTDQNGFWNSVLGGRTLGEYISDARQGVGQFIRTGSQDKQLTGLLWNDIKENWGKVLGPGDPTVETPLMTKLKFGPRAVSAGINEVGRLATAINGPFFDHFIPVVKQGMMYRNMQQFFDTHAAATPEQVARYAKQVVQDVDNRLGELNQNTLYWSKQLKQTFNIAMISPGWAYGTLRGGVAALGFNIERQAFEWNPVATTNLVGTVGAWAMYNSVSNYLHTGEMPRDLEDLAHFRTGGTVADTHGNPRKQMVMGPDGKLHSTGKNVEERGMMPSELKEYQDIGTIIATAWKSPGNGVGAASDYLLGKLAPGWQLARTLISGHDAVGHDIWHDPRGPGYFAKAALEPIFMNSAEGRKKGTGLTKLESEVLGWRPAPRWAEDWVGYQGEGNTGMAGVYGRADKEAIKRARIDAAQAETTPEWAKDLPPAAVKKPSAAERARQQFEATGSMAGITNPRTARYLNVLRAYHKQQSDPTTRLDPDIAAAQGQTLQDRLNRARGATAFDPVTGY